MASITSALAPPDGPAPYRSTPLFDERSLPIGLRRAHSTKAGVWGVIRVIEGRARLCFFDGTACRHLDDGHPGLLLPGQLHALEPIGAVKLRVDFYNRLPPV